MPPSLRKRTPPSLPLVIDPKTIRPHLRALIRRRDPLYQRDAPRQTHIILNEIWQFSVR